MRGFGRHTWPYALLAALSGGSAGMALAEEPPPAEQKVAPTAFNTEEPEPVLDWGHGDGHSDWVPIADILLFDFLLNQFNRRYIEPQEDYASDWQSFEDNLKGRWVFDDDSFDINQFGHPYQGSMYYGFARSAGHDYWSSLAFTFAGSALWETAGETTPPSVNDQFTTGIGGTLLGEPLFRMASLLLESGEGQPSGLRTFFASFISPGTGFNRLAFGDRFDGVFRSRDPAVHTRAQFGANLNATFRSDVNLNPDPNTPPVPQSYERGEAIVDFTMAYGLPGKPGYTYTRPFDYFHFQFTAATGNMLENLMTRGLLAGTTYGDGEHYRGIWGLYGSYDYIAPQIFRVSNTALGLGTTGQWWISQETALQCELIGSVGYGSGGITEGRGERDYHYGITPQGLLALRLILDDNVALELAARDYYISDRASDNTGGSENIARGDLGLTFRVWGLHGLTLKYAISHRNAHYETLPDTRQTVAAVSLGYTYLGHKWFGAVDWRPNPASRSDETRP
jgi:hypothetical protein